MTASVVEEFAWAKLPQFSSEEVRKGRELHAQVRRAVDPSLLRTAFESLLEERVGVHWTPWSRGKWNAKGRQFALKYPIGVSVFCEPDADLVRLCTARLLRQKFDFGPADVGLSEALRGAGAALVLELARRSAQEMAPVLELDAVPNGLTGSVRTAHVSIADKTYRVEIFAVANSPECQVASADVAGLGRLNQAAIRVALPWVAAVSQVSARLVSQLASGDVWLPGAEWFQAERGFAGSLEVPLSAEFEQGCLAPPGAEYGWPVLRKAGELILGAKCCAMPSIEEREVGMTQKKPDLKQLVADAPVLVRLEVGAVEMSASQWASLEPGDVVDSGCRVEAGVVLRAGGQVLARGELVAVNGNVGVRIVELAGEGPASS